ncbi:uncharacterized protein DUF2752 [Balneicella halophila]|uniref:Uncharacterized protein DUF2752 n=1 Tax=Balneicella halophila TaxID=1537566 RepID=A0A7L4UQU3_BALHA|nr:DUF2752 domain-containing protein [Balneicella halophila]PVX51811.1 uncharacterized protein DUF2752 [Balneicella halophila]
MWEAIKELFNNNMQSCFYKSNFGVECPGCGTQRAILLLMEGDVAGSFKMYPPLVLIVLTLIYLLLHLIFRFKNGGICLKYLGLATGFFMIFNYIYRILAL